MAEAMEEIQKARPRRFRQYPEYRDSGVEWLGEIPAHWGVRRLKTLISEPITDGPHETPEFLVDGVPFLSVDGIQKGELVFDPCRYISKSAHDDYRRKCSPRRDDILLGKAASTGKIARVKVDFEFSIWSPLALIRPDCHEVRADFLEYALKSATTQAQIDILCTSSTQKNISMRDIPILVMCVTDLAEQRAIASFLDRETAKIDGLVAKKDRLIELLQEKRTALITRAVTQGLDPNAPMKDSGVKWLGKIPAHWDVSRLKTAVALIEQGWSPLCDNRQADLEEWGVLKVGCVNGSEFDEREHKALPPGEIVRPEYEIRPGDILMSRANTRQLLGSAALVGSVRPRLLLCDKLYRIRLRSDIMTPRYLIYALSAPVSRFQFEREATGASGSMQNIAQGTIRELLLPVPPVKEQREIAQSVDKALVGIAGLIATVQLGIDRLREFRAALISAAVTGKIDVREEATT